MLRRIICKSICIITRDDAESVCGSTQLCTGVHYGVEGAIHAASDLFNNNDYGVLMMDAHNVSSSLNRISMIWSSCVLWPRASRFVCKTFGEGPF